MTALSRSIVRRSMASVALLAPLFAMPVLAAATVRGGAMVALTPAGYLTNASADASLRIVGVNHGDAVDNSAGVSGDLTCVPYRGAFYFTNSSSTDAITDADIGQNAFVVDNDTVARTSGYGARPVAGKIIGVDAVGVLVDVGYDAAAPAEDLLVLAGGDLSTKQFYGVDLSNSSGVAKAVVCSAAGQRCVGFVQNAPASGAVAIVRTIVPPRFSKAIAGGSVTAADSVAMTSAGKVKTAEKAVTNTNDAGSTTDALIGSNVCGIAMISASSDESITVLLLPQGAIPTTAA